MSEDMAVNVLEVEGRQIKVTSRGFLENLSDWDDAVANAIAAQLGLALSDTHWEIIHFIREYYISFDQLPNARVFTKAIKKRFGEEKGNSRYLYRLFPDGPLKSACRIGGLPKPTSCI